MWELIWKFLGGLSILSGAIGFIYIVRDQLKPVWERRFWLIRIWPWLVPSLPSGLARLAKDLDRIVERLNHLNYQSVNNIQKELCKLKWCVWVETISYTALHSKDDHIRCRALRNLSQAGEEKIEQVIHVVNGVLHDPGLSEEVKNVAEAVLKELEERQQLEKSVDGGGTNSTGVKKS